jgi:integral membrane protein (TIGR01906 family)
MKGLNFFITTALIVIIILSPLFLLMNKLFFTYEFYKQNIQDSSGMTKNEYLFYTDQVIKYFFNTQSRLTMKGQNNSTMLHFFTEEELLHMIDVKKIMRFVLALLILSVIAISSQLGKIRPCTLTNALIISFFFTAIISTILYFNFDQSFIIFHKILFRNQYWLLPEDSMLIRMFPEGFFYDYAISWFVMSCIPGFIAVLTKIFPRKKSTS